MNDRREWFEMSLEELAEIERERNKLPDLIDLWVPVPYLDMDGTWASTGGDMRKAKAITIYGIAREVMHRFCLLNDDRYAHETPLAYANQCTCHRHTLDMIIKGIQVYKRRNK